MIKKALVVILSPLLFFAMVELALSVFGIAESPRFWIESLDEATLKTNPQSPWQGLPFEPTEMARIKPEGTVRIFCLGGSTTNGFPFARHSSFSKWLQVRLEQLHPDRTFEVVKMGYDAKPTQEVADLCREIVDYDPDLLVVYSGHNQFLVQNLPDVRGPNRRSLQRGIDRTRVGRWLKSWLIPKDEPSGPRTPAKNPPRRIEVDPFLTGAELDVGYTLYEDALEDIIQQAEANDIPLLFCMPASNLWFAPRRSFVRGGLRAQDRKTLLDRFAAAEARMKQEAWGEALELLEEAKAFDDTPALLAFRMGECYAAMGDAERAREAFLEARDKDNHPCRATRRNEDILERVVGDRAFLADCRPLFEAAATNGIPGDDLFVDNCHPTLDAQYLIADAILRTLAKEKVLGTLWDFEMEPTKEIYRERMGLDLETVATDLSHTAILNLLRLLGRDDSVNPLDAAGETFRFALQHDEDNATARLGLAMTAALTEEEEQARSHLRASMTRDPKVWNTFQGLATQLPMGKEVLAALSPLVDAGDDS